MGRRAVILAGLLASIGMICPTRAGRTSQNTPQLARWLERFPAADTNRDGILTATEANSYRQGRRQSNPTMKPTHADVSYGPHERNVLDFWQAASEAPAPLVIFIHGGGFVGGDKSLANDAHCRQCLEAGVSFAAINYRFRNPTPLTDVIRDLARAVQFLRSEAETLNIDKTRIAVYGGSAGAGSSLWLAFHDDLADPDSPDPVLRESTRVTAAGALSTQATYNTDRWPEVLNMDPEQEVFSAWRKSQNRLAGDPGAAAKEAAAKKFLDMLAHMDADDPPIYLNSQGPDEPDADIVHHPRHAKFVKKKCDELGIEAILVVRETPRDERVEVIDFLLTHLRVLAN